MKKINGVTGELKTNELGFTLMHEHVFFADWNMRKAFSSWINIEGLIEATVEEIHIAQESGVKTLVDVTPINLGRDIHVIEEVAKRTGIQIIAATGFFYNEEQYIETKSEQLLTELLISEIEKGIQGTAIKAGIIKCATDSVGVTKLNEKLLKVAASAHKQTGVPIYTHSTVENETGYKQLEILDAQGADLSKVVIGHVGDTDDINYLEKILKSGCYIGLDRFGYDCFLPLEKRIKTLVELCNRNWTNRILVSHDHAAFTDWGENLWKNIEVNNLKDEVQNFGYIKNKVFPKLLESGLTEEQIRQIVIQNPQDFFSN